MKKTRPPWVALAVVLLAATGACSKPAAEGVATAGGQVTRGQADPSRPADDPQERVRQFIQCMRDQGIDVPDPEPGNRTGKSALRFATGEIDKAVLGPAMEKCNEFLPEGGAPPQPTPEQIERQRRFAQCMRDNGVPWPDPDPQTGGFQAGDAVPLRKDDPATMAALEKCRSQVVAASSEAGQG